MANIAFSANSDKLAVAIKAVIRKTINLNSRIILNNAGIDLEMSVMNREEGKRGTHAIYLSFLIKILDEN